jgi:hypothetical protein
VRPEGLGQFKNRPHRDLNPRPSGLQHSALTTTLPRAPRFVSLQFLNTETVDKTPWMGDQSIARTATYTNIINTDKLHALNGIRIHDPNVRADENNVHVNLSIQ